MSAATGPPPSTTGTPPATECLREYRKCSRSVAYFLDAHGRVYDATARDWVPFRLWDCQLDVLDAVSASRLLVILKARQLGMTWLCLGYALWLLLFRPAATVLLFSRRDDEATDLLAVRLRGMYDRLPDWLKAEGMPVDNDHEWELSNGSRALAFPTTAGDSYTATFALVDEADLVPDLDRLLRAVKPTVDAGGQLVLLSRPDKSKLESPFKKTYLGARAGASPWRAVFLPWQARPGRDQAWYEEQRADVLARTGSLDDLNEQYPATDAEALAPRSLDKRIRPEWLQQCLAELPPLARLPHNAPSLPGLVAYQLPQPRRKYVLGADPAEGNPTSDDSALAVLDDETGEECACLAGRFEPAVFASHLSDVATWYNNAAVMVERNNHGWAVLDWLRDNAGHLRRLPGHDGKPGWMSSTKGKALLYGHCADAFRTADTLLHTFATYVQLASVEGATLRAPEGQHDDRADSYALALAARVSAPAPPPPVGGGSPPRVAPMPGGHYRQGGYPR